MDRMTTIERRRRTTTERAWLGVLWCLIVGAVATGCQRGGERRQEPTAAERAARRDSLEALFNARRWTSADSLGVALREARASGDSVAVAVACRAAAMALQNKQRFAEAAQVVQTGIEALHDTPDTILEAALQNTAATGYRRMGALFEASDRLYDALHRVETFSGADSPEGKRMRAFLYNNLGNVYKYLNDGDEAEIFFRRAIVLDEELGNNNGVAMNYSTLGSIYEYRKQNDSALAFYNRALERNIRGGSVTGIAICHNHIGQLLMKHGEMDSALVHHRAAYRVLQGEGEVWNRQRAALSMAWIYLQKNNLEAARRLLDETEVVALRAHSFGHLEETYYCQAEYYRRRGDYRAASDRQARCLDCRDSMARQRDEREVVQNRIRYEREKNDAEVFRLHRRNEAVEANRQLILFSSVLIGSILIVLLVLSVLLIRLQRRRNRELREMNATKDKFFSIISHDLKNPALAQRNALQALVNDAAELDAESLSHYYAMLLKSADAQVELLYNLLDWARVQTGRIPFTPVTFSLSRVVEDEVSLMHMPIESKSIRLTVDVSDDLCANADRNMVATVLRNLLTNAIKFSHPEGRIAISARQDGAWITVSVADDGVGMSADKLRTLFDAGREQSTRGTRGETGSGLGLVVCKHFVERNGGRLTAHSEESRGTTFHFTLKAK